MLEEGWAAVLDATERLPKIRAEKVPLHRVTGKPMSSARLGGVIKTGARLDFLRGKMS